MSELFNNQNIQNGLDLTFGELQEMAARQQSQIEAQQQMLFAKEQRLKFLKQQQMRQQFLAGENDRMRRLRDVVDAQEAKLKKLRAVRGQVEQTQIGNNNLASELATIKSLFHDKEKELASAVKKVEELSKQLELIRSGQNQPHSSNLNKIAELQRLKNELANCRLHNEQQNKKLLAQKELFQSKKKEINAMDERIAELQSRLQKKRAQEKTNLLNKETHNSMKNSQNSIQGRNSSATSDSNTSIPSPLPNLSRDDPKYRTLPTHIKFIGNERHFSKNLEPSQSQSAASIENKQKNFSKYKAQVEQNNNVLVNHTTFSSNQNDQIDPSRTSSNQNDHIYPSSTSYHSISSNTSVSHSPKMLNLGSNIGGSSSGDNLQSSQNENSSQVQVSHSESKLKSLYSNFAPRPYGTAFSLTQKRFTVRDSSAVVTCLNSTGSKNSDSIFSTQSSNTNDQSRLMDSSQVKHQTSIGSILSTTYNYGNSTSAAQINESTLPSTRGADSFSPASIQSVSVPNHSNYSTSVFMSSGHSQTKPSYTYAPKNIIANTYTGRLGNSTLSQYQNNLKSAIKNSNLEQPPLSAVTSSVSPPVSTITTVSQSPTNPVVMRRPAAISSPPKDNPLFSPTSPPSAHEESFYSATASLLTDQDKKVGSRGSLIQQWRHRHHSNDSNSSIQLAENSNSFAVSSSSNKVSSPLSLTDSSPKPDVPKSISANIPSSLPKSILRAQSNSQTSKKSKRVQFDALALLLDASLEGEIELIKKTAVQVDNASAANDEGITALHNAICAGHYEIVKYLVEFGCDVNAPDTDGWTPLHCAASCNNLPMVKLIIEHGACIFATTFSDHETAAEKCEEEEDGYDGCSEYLYNIQEKLGIFNKGVVYAVFDYTAQNPDELSFKSGTGLVVIRKEDVNETEWWWARQGSNEGYIPRNLLGLYPRIRKQNEKIANGPK